MIGPLYQAVLDAAAIRRASTRREIRSCRREHRLASFVASIERTRWARQGRSVVFF